MIIQENSSPTLELSKRYRKPSISVIFSTFNEENNPFFIESLKALQGLGDLCETIIVDKMSSDKTQSIAKEHGAIVFQSSSNSRGERLNLGAKKSRAPLLLFHHPRSSCSQEAYRKIMTINAPWGCFTHRFDRTNLILNFTSWYSNNIRVKIKEIVYLDHCLFVEKNLFEKCNGLDNVDIFEDTLLSLKLNKLAAPTLIPFYATTSSKRFVQNGILQQVILNQILKIAFLLGADDKIMNKIYEKGLNLNSKY